MASWPPEAEKCIESVQATFIKALRAGADVLAIRDGSSLITDGHVRESAAQVMRGGGIKPRWQRMLLAFAEYMSALLSGTGFLILSAPVKEPIAQPWIAGVMFCAGAVLFILLKQL